MMEDSIQISVRESDCEDERGEKFVQDFSNKRVSISGFEPLVSTTTLVLQCKSYYLIES
jgi:hypothetical protein